MEPYRYSYDPDDSDYRQEGEKACRKDGTDGGSGAVGEPGQSCGEIVLAESLTVEAYKGTGAADTVGETFGYNKQRTVSIDHNYRQPTQDAILDVFLGLFRLGLIVAKAIVTRGISLVTDVVYLIVVLLSLQSAEQ